jgi:hypothetical protein
MAPSIVADRTCDICGDKAWTLTYRGSRCLGCVRESKSAEDKRVPVSQKTLKFSVGDLPDLGTRSRPGSR